jgi:Transposase
MMWFAGIDWADSHHDTVVIDAAGRKVAQLRVEHTPDGLKKKVALLT